MNRHPALSVCQDLATYARAHDLHEADELLLEVIALLIRPGPRPPRTRPILVETARTPRPAGRAGRGDLTAA